MVHGRVPEAPAHGHAFRIHDQNVVAPYGKRLLMGFSSASTTKMWWLPTQAKPDDKAPRHIPYCLAAFRSSNPPFTAMLRSSFLLYQCGLLAVSPLLAATADDLSTGWDSPPQDAKLRAYWWWLNSNVTEKSITRDLEEMKAKGFGGALICDAGGATQEGNAPVPAGPTFLSPAWRQLYRHALREAARLGLEMSLNIQSGWNLGGPCVTAADAAKKLVWTETTVTAAGPTGVKLAAPTARDGYYRDWCVVAYPLAEAVASGPVPKITASSSQGADHAAALAFDGDPETFWVSKGNEPGKGPQADHPEWLELRFETPFSATNLLVTGRPGYGPRECTIEVSEDGKTFKQVNAAKDLPPDKPVTFNLPRTPVRAIRLSITASHDPMHPTQPRNVQIAELRVDEGFKSFPAAGTAVRPIRDWQAKAMQRTLSASAPDTTPLLTDIEARPGEADTPLDAVVDLTDRLAADGTLRWRPTKGSWRVLRFGCTIGDHAKVSTCSEGWNGYALDVLDAGAFNRYWNAVVEPLIVDAGPLAGKTLAYLHTDSWEVEAVNWTPTLRVEFRARRGYDIVSWLPVLTGKIVADREQSNRFMHDYRKTLGDLAIANHYAPFVARAEKHGLKIHPESGGPHASPIDAQRCLGMNHVPMSEFWAWSWKHRIGDPNRFFVKQPASAAHVNGRKLVAAEGFTTIGPHWQETLWDNLKPAFDHACTEGFNLLFWHAFVCSPESEGIPGQQYFAGTHLNPNVTWWSRSAPFFSYINRSQWMLQQGKFVADVCYYYGDHVPNFAQGRASDPAQVGPGRDYDVITEDAILTRLSCRNGLLVLPDGMSYRMLVLRDNDAISLPVLRKLRELVAAGATVIGPRPVRATGLTDYPQSDAEVRNLAEELWGAGKIVAAKSAGASLLATGLKPDFAWTGDAKPTTIGFIHRRTAAEDIYFVNNREPVAVKLAAEFRITGKGVELWDAVSGDRRVVAGQAGEGTTKVPLALPPCGSVFVVFRGQAAPTAAPSVLPEPQEVATLAGPWSVRFDPAWGGPAQVVEFADLVDWTTRPEPGIRYYSGTATYQKQWDWKGDPKTAGLLLDLGALRELAEVKLNGRSLGIVWAPPFRVAIPADALKPGTNNLEIAVVNFWPNRIIGDASQPAGKRFTRTNVRMLTAKTPLVSSGLLGPVRVLRQMP